MTNLHSHSVRTFPILGINFDSDQLFITLIELMSKPNRSETLSSMPSFDMSAEEMSLGEKVEKVAVQSEWLRRNQPILTSLYEHCMMIGSGDSDLPGTWPHIPPLTLSRRGEVKMIHILLNPQEKALPKSAPTPQPAYARSSRDQGKHYQ